MKTIISLLLIVSMSGCATVFRGTSQTVEAQSDPEGAAVSVNGRYFGKTPTRITLDRGSHEDIEFTLNGYELRQSTANKSLDGGWAVWDIGSCVIPIALCIPLIVDAISGAWNDFDDTHAVHLDKKAVP